ncbi:hypothetical protein DEU56DRAFT_753112 [Suillus clintonianus]|uniref:uncharacterized protein n=1 Tax=Suillus clintonianus TaxID=1904413 RepID=UPI001B860996|nr:uncharacterized protein DEU56DRAFT_753112 [Suillus clintonianus]KAG2148879.1 hypothetical protein DEU56DRAFT_753112 [Suillus clintonianus]
MPYDPDKSSDHSSRSPDYNDSAEQILGGGDSHRIILRFPANGQGAPEDSEGNYIYDKIYPEYQPPGLKETLDESAKSRSPSSKGRSIAAGDEVPNEHPIDIIPEPNLKRALSSDSNTDLKSDENRHFADAITNSPRRAKPPRKKQRVTLQPANQAAVSGNLRLGEEIVGLLREQIAVLAHILEVVVVPA